MQTLQEQQPVRRQAGNEESGRPIRVDVEGALWSGLQASSIPGRDKKDSYGDQFQKAPKFKIDRQETIPRCDGGVD